ncbi:uncharacterized protein LOC119720010 [Patiria miniata]|uniref:Uncharacterized protein n=1 Tax=Patiria miniata TaxID=46514 RepID=A0A913Z0K0_PATMI|nr:uncharacterized protein LOC119720010 [Patiria miniata]
MNKLAMLVVCCLFLQLASGASLAFSRREDTRSRWADLQRKLHQPRGDTPITQSGQIAVPTIARYGTTETVTLSQDETQRFVGELCSNSSMGKAVNVTVHLHNNAGWEPVQGVVDVYVVDSNCQGGVLCTNKDDDGYATAYCLIESWPSLSNIMIVVKAGPVSGIKFSLAAEFYEQGTQPAAHVKTHMPSHIPNLLAMAPLDQPAITLTQSVEVFPSVSLGSLERALLEFTWCSDNSMIMIQSTVMSSDGESTYAQYICETLPCDVGTNNIIEQTEYLPTNTVQTDPMNIDNAVGKKLYVVVTSWGGPYDSAGNAYVSNFLYSANQH